MTLIQKVNYSILWYNFVIIVKLKTTIVFIHFTKEYKLYYLLVLFMWDHGDSTQLNVRNKRVSVTSAGCNLM